VLAFFDKLPPCLVVSEARASSHHWSRENGRRPPQLCALMPPAYVKPYVKRNKNDAIDAEAICEAVTRPNMRFVATKTRERQSGLRTPSDSAISSSVSGPRRSIAIRTHLVEFGIVASVGAMVSRSCLMSSADPNDKRVPE